MTRFLALLSCLLLMFGLCIGVSAADNTSATTVNIFATVSGSGNCDVTTTVALHVGTPLTKPTFPIPAEASNVTLNGRPVLTEKTAQARYVNLNRILGGMTGDFSFTISYSMHSMVEPLASEVADETAETPVKRMQLELPMLAGFPYPIEELQFSINLPGPATQAPTFISGYHQANIEKDLTYTMSGNNIAGRSWAALKDHETLVMYLNATEEMFPQTRAELPDAESLTPLIWILSGIALAYWILFLRNFIPIRFYPSVAPEGFGAGQMGTILTMAGADLNLMIFSWAQLGYVDMRLDRRGKVLVMKRMDMGNERTGFEQKCFYKLFVRKEIVDTASSAYQKLHQAVAAQNSAPQLLRHKGAGNVKIFRIIMAAAGLLSGACFGIYLGNMLDYGWVFMSILACLGAFCSWHIQLWPQGVFLHHRSAFYVSLILCLLWLALGITIAQFGLALIVVLLQVVAGFLAAFGGRRSEEGCNVMGQVLSLRRHFRKLTPYRIHQMCQENPELFFDMVPYAIALGQENVLARRFGSSKLPLCPYLYSSNTSGLTARQWSQLMRIVLDGMTARQRNWPPEPLRSILKKSTKPKF